MAVFGVTPEGFKKKRLSDIKLEEETSLRATLGNNINLLPASVFGNLVGVYSDRMAKLWELAEQIYHSQYKKSAEGINLDNVLALIAVPRLGARKSVQTDLHLFGTPGTTVDAGLQVSVQGSPSSTFKTSTSVILGAGTDEVQTIGFSAVATTGTYRLKFRNEETLPIAWNATAQQIQDALNALSKLEGLIVVGTTATSIVITFAGNSGKIDQPLLEVTENGLLATATPITATVTETTKGVAQAKINAECTIEGAVVAPGYSLIVIDTPVAGLDRVLNPEDATVGRAIEEDNDYRIRSETAQQGTGSGTVEAIRARLLNEVTGVTQAIVFENDGDVVDVNGLPAHSFRAYVQGGADADILQKIWEAKGGGIKPDGDISGVITDSQGITHTMRFSRPDFIEVYITLKIWRDLAKFPADGEAQLRAALAGYVNALNIGDDVIVFPALLSSINSISGITDVEIGVDTSPAPPLGTDDNIPVAINEVAKVVNPNTDIGITFA